jgi:hypothetical protein
MARGLADVASQSWQDGEPPPCDEVRGQTGLITLTQEANHSHRKVRLVRVESRRSGQSTANALIGGCRARKGRIGLARTCGVSPRFRRTWRPSESTDVRQGVSEVKGSGEALPVEGRGGSCGEQQVAVANSDEICEGLRPRSAPKSPRLKTAVCHREAASANFAALAGKPMTNEGGVAGLADPPHAGSHQPNTLSEGR